MDKCSKKLYQRQWYLKNKERIMKLKNIIISATIYVGAFGLAMFLIWAGYSCIFQKPLTYAEGGVQNPASVCEYQVRFISTTTYKTLEDFWVAVGDTVTYLNENGYEVLDIVPKYGKDMTQKEILKFVYIKYIKEKK